MNTFDQLIELHIQYCMQTAQKLMLAKNKIATVATNFILPAD